MITFIDAFLNRITMYRLVLYGLVALLVHACVLSALGFLSFGLVPLVTSLIVLLVVSVIVNEVCSRLFHAPSNSESSFITAFILFFILFPAQTATEYMLLAAAAALAIASKYVVAYKHKHLINPAVFGLVALALFGSGEAIWWIGSATLFPVVLAFGLLVVRKLRRYALPAVFLGTALVTSIAFGIYNEFTLSDIALTFFLSGPALFFASIMLTEPLTTPPGRTHQIVYGALVGLLFGSQFSFGTLYSSPEIALFVGNIYAYAVSPKYRLKLLLKEKTKLAKNLFEFVFSTNEKVSFSPGQYFEWTLPHKNADQRGMRRYFTIASSPTEDDIRLGVRIEETRSSSFKKALMELGQGDIVAASSLAGDFVLPADTQKKLVFIAGGIGVTPFRSMVKCLLDTGERRDIVFFYANRSEDEIAYKELFEEARGLGIRMVYVVNEASSQWSGYKGFLTEDILRREVGDLKERVFYISGSHGMVTAFEGILQKSGVPTSNIRTDFFPGFA